MENKKQTLLGIRKKNKTKKPDFVLRDSKNKSRVPSRWRKPRGKQSPVRQRHKGRIKRVSIGYGSPKLVKNLHLSGLKQILVKNKKQLESINPQEEGVILAKTTGIKKRIELIKLGLEKNITFLNLTEPQKYLQELEGEFQKRKESKKKKVSEKEKKEQEKKKKAAEKEKKEQEEKDKDKQEKPASEIKKDQEEEKKKIEKTLIQKQA